MEKGTLFALAGALLMLLPPVLPAQEIRQWRAGSGSWELVDELQKEVLIAPGGSYCAWYDNSTRRLADEDPYSDLTLNAMGALAKVPGWLRNDLARQFCELGAEMDRYADVIHNAADQKYIDEIAFAVAHTSSDLLRSTNFNPGVFLDNAASVYAADQHLDYVNITEKADHTTVTYTNSTGAKVELPRDIYYWYIVHPKITDEAPLYIDPATGGAAAPPTGKFWRDYLFNHNDTGYPLLREALSGVPTIWNGTKNSCTDNGAVGVVTKWILDVMDFGSGAERPTQPVRIYALHLGRCGEHEDITAAAARAALIPCIGAEDIAEDHVWNEFWCGGAWHQWEPVNVYVDFPESYGGWGKKFPAVSGWRGDDCLWTETAMYTQTATLRISVRDLKGIPVDGATVWIGSEYSGGAAYRMLASWNSTNETGVAEFKVGKGNNIYSRVDTEKLGGAPTASASSTGANPWVLFATDTSQVVANAQPTVYNHTFTLARALAPVKGLVSEGPPQNGSYRMELRLEVTGSEVKGRSALGPHYFSPAERMPVYSFIASDAEYGKFGSGSGFKGYSFAEGTSSTSEQMLPYDGKWRAVVGNDAPATVQKVKLTIRFYVTPYITIRNPLDGDIYSEGNTIHITGTADGANLKCVELSFDGGRTWSEAYDSQYCNTYRLWGYDWRTDRFHSGNYTIMSRLGDDGGVTYGPNVTVFIDADDPVVSLTTAGVMKGGADIELRGTAGDNLGLANVELKMLGVGETGTPRRALLDRGDGTWSLIWQTVNLVSGAYCISVTAADIAGRTETVSENITLDFNAPTVALATKGLFGTGAVLRVEGTAHDDEGPVNVVLVEGGLRHNVNWYGKGWFFEWNTTGLPSGSYVFTAQAEDLAGWNASAAAAIELDADAPRIRLEAPESAEAGSIITLAGTLRDQNGITDAELATGGGSWADIAPDENGDWSFGWDTTELMPSNYSISVRAIDVVGNLATVSKTVTLLDTTAPELSMEMPREIQAGQPLAVKVKLVERTGVGRVEYSTDGMAWANMTPAAKGYAADIDTRTLSLGKNRIWVRACDLAGNLGEASRDVNVADDTAPAVTIAELTVLKNSLSARGNASDNYRVRAVEYTIDNLRWSALELSNGSWNLSFTGLKGGKYSLKVRATDMAGKTSEATRDFEVARPAPAAKGFIGGFELVGAIAALAAAALLAGRPRGAPRKG